MFETRKTANENIVNTGKLIISCHFSLGNPSILVKKKTKKRQSSSLEPRLRSAGALHDGWALRRRDSWLIENRHSCSPLRLRKEVEKLTNWHGNSTENWSTWVTQEALASNLWL